MTNEKAADRITKAVKRAFSQEWDRLVADCFCIFLQRSKHNTVPVAGQVSNGTFTQRELPDIKQVRKIVSQQLRKEWR